MRIGRPPHDQAGHGRRPAPPAGRQRHWRVGDQAGLVDHQRGRVLLEGTVQQPTKPASSLPIDWRTAGRRRRRGRQPNCSSFPRSRPIHTVGWPHLRLSLQLSRAEGRPGCARRLDHPNSDQSVACPHRRFPHPIVPVATAPKPSKRQGLVSHAGTAGFPKPSAWSSGPTRKVGTGGQAAWIARELEFARSRRRPALGVAYPGGGHRRDAVRRPPGLDGDHLEAQAGRSRGASCSSPAIAASG